MKNFACQFEGKNRKKTELKKDNSVIFGIADWIIDIVYARNVYNVYSR